MSKYLTVVKQPTESKVIEVNKQEIIKMKQEYPSISMGNHDDKYLKDFKDNDIVGYVAGDLKNIKDKDADLWFINKTYFAEHYTILDK